MANSYDTSKELTLTNPGTSNTTSYTIGSGSNSILFVWTLIGSVTDTLTAITFGGSGMSLLQKGQESGSNFWNYLHYFLNPSGTANIVQSTSNSVLIFGVAASYFGVKQSAPNTSGINIQPSSVGSLTQTLTTTVDLCWQAGIFRAQSGPNAPTAGTNLTLRKNGTTGGYIWGDTNASITPAGGSSIQASVTPNQPWIGLDVAFEPAASTGPRKLPFLGVG